MNHSNPPNHDSPDEDNAHHWNGPDDGHADDEHVDGEHVGGEHVDGEHVEGAHVDGEPEPPPSDVRVDAGSQVREILNTVGGQLEKLTEIQREHEAAAHALDERERRVVEAENALDARRAQLSEEKSALESETQVFHGQEEQAGAARSEQLTDDRAALDLEREQWEEQRRIAEAAQAEQEADVARRESDLAEHAARIAAEREDVGATGAALEEERQSARTQVAALESELQDLRRQLDEAGAREEARAQEVSELTRQSVEARNLLEEKTRIISEYNNRIEHMMTRCAELESSLAAGAQRADQLETAGLELAQDAEAERDAALEDLRVARAERDEAGRLVEQAVQSREELEAKVAVLEKDVVDSRSSSGGARTEIGADVRVQAMQLRINKLEAQLAQVRSMPGLPKSAPAAAPAGAPADRAEDESRLKDFRAKAHRLAEVAEHLRTRQGRLKKTRRLLRNRKPVPVKQVVDMEQHAAQMRHIGQQRHELAEKRNKLAQTERRMIRKWARSRSIVLTGWLLFMALVAAGSAWFAVDHFKPAIVSASVTMEAKSKSRQPLTDDASLMWQNWHAGLALDDGFHETLAQRFYERRLDAYAEKSAVSKCLEDLRFDYSQPGRLTFTLAGTDAGEVKTVLDLVATSILTESDAQKRKRGDNAWAELPPARVEDGREAYSTLNPVPIDDQRLIYAGPAFGVILVILLVISRFICGRLADVKYEFDADDTLFDPLPQQGGRAADGTVKPYEM